MANFCSNCGMQLNPNDRFCPNCGQPLTAGINNPNAAPANQAPRMQAGQPSRPQTTPQPAPKKTTRKAPQTTPQTAPRPASPNAPRPASAKAKGVSGLSILLTAVMVIEFLVAGLKYPGFLRKGGSGDEPFGHISSVIPEGSGKTDSTGGMGGDGLYTSDSGDTWGDIPLRYSRKQIEAAEAKTDAVSWWDAEADFGDVTVQLDPWTLDEENDQLTVRELPEITEGEEGWGIRAYDFSLDSGQSTFSTNVTISIPRTSTEPLAGCVWYNEEEDIWEDVYYEISNDGKNYLIYTDHFSLYGEKLYRFDAKNLDLVESNGDSINLQGGVFVEVPKAGVNRMNWDVRIDYNRMWNLYQKKTEEDIRNYSATIQSMMHHSDHIAENRRVYKHLDDFQNIFGDSDSITTLVFYPSETAEQILHGVKEAESDALGDFLFAVDAMFTSLKILQEAKKGSHIMEEVIQKLPGAVEAHAGDIAGAGVSLAAGAYLAPWAAALVGLAWWAGGKLMDLKFGDTTFIDPTLESLQQYQCSLKNVSMKYGDDADPKTFFKNQKRTIPMSKPASMTEEDFEVLKATVEKTPLQRFSRDEIKSAQDFYDYYVGSDDASDKILYKGWSEAFLAILTACSDDGSEYLSTVLDEFYWNYAYAFWQLDEDILDQICESYYSTKKEGTLLSIRELNDGKPLTGATKIHCAEDFVQILKQETKPILLKALTTMQQKSCQVMMQDIRKQIMPLLNCKLKFQVQDQNLKPDEPFQNSIYCVDWTQINANRAYVRGDEGLRYDDPAFVTPMRFAGVEKACFLPLLPSDEADISQPSRNRAENYYPYTPDFVPRANQTDNTVYECTYYHYMMMGAPLQMTFKDARDSRAYASAPEITAKIMIPNLAREDTKTYRNKYSGFSYQVKTMVPLKEAVVPVIIPKEGIKVPTFDMDLVQDNPVQYYYLQKDELNYNSHLTLKQNGEFTLTIPRQDEHWVYEDDWYHEYYEQDPITFKGQAVMVREAADNEGEKYTHIYGPIEGGGAFHSIYRTAYPLSDGGEHASITVTEIKEIKPGSEAKSSSSSEFQIFYYPDGHCQVMVTMYGTVRDLEWDEERGKADPPHTDRTDDYYYSIDFINESDLRSPGLGALH